MRLFTDYCNWFANYYSSIWIKLIYLTRLAGSDLIQGYVNNTQTDESNSMKRKRMCKRQQSLTFLPKKLLPSEKARTSRQEFDSFLKPAHTRPIRRPLNQGPLEYLHSPSAPRVFVRSSESYSNARTREFNSSLLFRSLFLLLALYREVAFRRIHRAMRNREQLFRFPIMGRASAKSTSSPLSLCEKCRACRSMKGRDFFGGSCGQERVFCVRVMDRELDCCLFGRGVRSAARLLVFQSSIAMVVWTCLLGTISFKCVFWNQKSWFALYISVSRH